MFIVTLIRKIFPLSFLPLIPSALYSFFFNVRKYRVRQLPGNVWGCFYFPLFLDCFFSLGNLNLLFNFFPFLNAMRCLYTGFSDVVPGTHKARQIIMSDVKFNIKFGKLNFLHGQARRHLPDSLSSHFTSSFHLFKYNFIDYQSCSSY